MKDQITKLLDIARSQLNTMEAATNKVKYNEWYYGLNVSGINFDWCGVFVAWCFDQAGLENLAFGDKSSARKAVCEGVINWKRLGQSRGAWFTKDFKIGDVVLFDFNLNGVPDHIGIIENVNSDGTVFTIEGNTTSGTAIRGEGVFRRLRDRKHINGVFRPAYTSVPSEVPTPKPLKKTNEEIADEVLRGMWGNGNERIDRLSAAGYDPKAIQTIVNGLLNKKKTNDQIADEVIDGLWSNGNDRVARLKAAGYDPGTVQQIVNAKLKVK